MKLFNELGSEIEARWNAAGYDDERFPTIAADALRRAGLPGKISAWDVIEWTLAEPMLPDQKDLRGSFGDPPITVFNASRFYIDVYFWFEGTTAIHEHGFCGAFQVLDGSSLHSWYHFEPRTVLSATAEIGDLSLNSCELLNVGDVKEIHAGRRYIHSLFHLDQPSVTIVVRTFKLDKFLPQFAYHKPCLAVDPFYEVPVDIKKLQSMFALLRANHSDADGLISETIRRSDLQTTFNVLTNLRRYLGSDDLKAMFAVDERSSRFNTFLAAARERHGELFAAIEDAIEHESTTADIVRRRMFVTDPELRFFLALLLNVDGKERIFGLIKQKFPNADPAAKILDWTYDLANRRLAGPVPQTVLGIPDFDDSDLFVLEKMLTGETDDIAEHVKNEYSAEKAERMLESLPDRIRKINDAPIFKPLFAQDRSVTATVPSLGVNA